MKSMELRPVPNSFLWRMRRCGQKIAWPTEALPLDILRVLSGLLFFAYFLRTLLEVPDFSGPNGLIDHRLSTEIFWFTRMGLFQPGMSAEMFQLVFLLACLCSISLIIGFQTRLAAVMMYLIAVSTYRWNFLVIYVDDAIMHLLLFWMIVLPVGRTLILSDWLKNGRAAWDRWKTVMVPGITLRCFLWNLSLLYLVAGLWKWTSPMWRDGTALYVVFQLPISYGRNFWGPEYLPVLKIFNYAALIIEPLVPLMFLLPKGHYAKYALLVAFIGLHLGSTATLNIPFANLACAGVAILILREELMDWLRGGGGNGKDSEPELSGRAEPAGSLTRIGISGGIAVFMVSILTLAMLSSINMPQWRTPARQNFNPETPPPPPPPGGPVLQTQSELPVPRFAGGETEARGYDGLGSAQMTFFGILWSMGIAQQYQLFNWIDDRNFTVHYQINEYRDDEIARAIEPETMFLPSTRGVLLQFYLHGVTWAQIPPERRGELRKSLLTRIASRYCRNYRPIGKIEVYSALERIDPHGGKMEPAATHLMSFSCQNTEPSVRTLIIEP